MYYVEVAPIKIARIGAETYTYLTDQKLPIGQIVGIQLGKSSTIGVVMEHTKKPNYDVKPIDSIVEVCPLPTHLIDLIVWISQYYKTPLALCMQLILPRGITKKRRDVNKFDTFKTKQRTTFVLNEDQAQAVTSLANGTGTHLLHGVTGAGKTAVYIERAKQTLSAGQSAIILVPEIALTSQLVAEFSSHFPDNILLTHSKQTEAQRHRVWQHALNANKPVIAIGPRSALFLPIANVGLIVIDECHEPSFQQEQSPRYSALRVASKYMSYTGGLALFGSATPLINDYYLAEKNNRIISLPKPARTNASTPDISLIDMTKRNNFHRHRFLSDSLLATIDETVFRGKQVLIFHNRRGSASTTLCEACGWQAGCPRCFIPMTLHADKHTLHCHICNMSSTVPTFCPSCGSVDVIHKGIGTKLIESELRRLFPKQTIARFDGDSSSEETVAERYDELKNGSIDIIIGTQVIAKGLDLPELEMVGVVQADAGLTLPDYSSPERTFQLLAQVVGRVGRSETATKVIVQSYQPTHPIIQDGLSQNYNDFYERTLAHRLKTHFPPDRYLMKLTCIYKTEAAVIRNAKQLMGILHQHKHASVELLGPTPSFYERVGETYRWQIVVKSPVRKHLLTLLDHLPASHWQYELDPLSLL